MQKFRVMLSAGYGPSPQDFYADYFRVLDGHLYLQRRSSFDAYPVTVKVFAPSIWTTCQRVEQMA